MTIVTCRPAALIALLATTATLLAGCGSGPSQTNAAVIFGDRVVTVDEVQQRLNTALKAEPAARELAKNHRLDLVSRGIVNQLVRHELIAAAAQRANLTVSEQDVTELTTRRAPAEDPIQRSVEAAFSAKEIATDQLLTVNLGRTNVDKVQLTLDGAAIQVPDFTKEKATELARQMAATPDRAADIGRAAVGEDSQQSQALQGFPWNAVSRYANAAQNAQGQAPPPAALFAQLFAAPPNSVIMLQLGSGENAASGGWLIVRVRRSDAGIPAEERVYAAEVPAIWQYALGEHLLGPFAKELGVRISPRYGVWDELAVGVAPSEGEKVGTVLPTANRRS